MQCVGERCTSGSLHERIGGGGGTMGSKEAAGSWQLEVKGSLL